MPYANVCERMLQKPIMVIAHGGGRAYGPPNSILAIEKSIDLNVDMIEIDVHLSKDRVPVVIHDHFLECTDIKKKYPRKKKHLVSEYTLKELKVLDIGAWFLDEISKTPNLRVDYLRDLSLEEQQKYILPEDMEQCKQGVEIPTLEEVMSKIKNTSIFINVEVKQMPRRYPDIIGKVMEIIKRYDMSGRTILSCFDHEILASAKELDPQITTGILIREKLYYPHKYCESLNSRAYHVSCLDIQDAIGINSEYYQKNKKIPQNKGLQELLKHNIGTNVWTVNDKEHMLAMLKMPYITGIFTDFPHRLQECMQK